MSMLIGRAVEEKLKIKLDMLGFIYGNIIPDISPVLLKIPHYRNKAAEFVNSEIRALMDYKLRKHSECSKEFSMRLGIVMHYLCDFFCHAHTSTYQGSPFQHYMYELKLFKFGKNLSSSVNIHYSSRHLHIKGSYEHVIKVIDKLHKIYESKTPSLRLDTAFITRISTFAVLNIVSSCIGKEINLAA